MGRMIVDADVLIDATRNIAMALDFIDKYEADIVLSVVTVAELYSGIREAEETRIANLCGLFAKIDITEKIALHAGRLRNHYGKRHGTGLADCLVAATALTEHATLVTLNKKHYPMMQDNLLIPYKKS